MDLRVYYRKVREVTETISGDFAVLVSLETPDGGKPGVMSEAPRSLAARLVVDGKARLATTEEAAEFAGHESRLRTKAEEELMPNRWPVAMLSETDLSALKSARSGSSSGKSTDNSKK